MGLSCSPGGKSHPGRPGAPLTRRRASGSVVPMIQIRALTKRYGRTTAVSDLTFTVQPGVVTGLLGPNGAGKSTTMRMILGLGRATAARSRSTASAPAHARRCASWADAGPRAVHRPAAPITICSRSRRPPASAVPGR